MCILSYLPAGVAVDEDGLFNGGMNNPDGHGWAIVANNARELIIGKSLHLSEALEQFSAARKVHDEGPALFHSRWATHGSISTPNCHPFYVGGSKRTVVAHNGVLPAAAHPGKGDDRSDTRLFADEILSTRYRRFDKVTAFRALSDFCGTYNKLVILTVDPKYRRNAYLVNEKAGNWDQLTGIWHSNYDYLDMPHWWHKYATDVQTIGTKAVTSAGKKLAEADDNCLLCNYGWVNSFGFCTECGTCQDCFEYKADCQCYWTGQGARAEDSERTIAESDLLTAEEVAELESQIDQGTL